MDLHPGEEIVFEGHPSWRGVLSFYVYGIGAAVIVRHRDRPSPASTAIGSSSPSSGSSSSSSSASCGGSARTTSSPRSACTSAAGSSPSSIQQTRIDRVQNVNTDQRLLDRILRVGTVDFDTAGTDDSDFTFRGIANPDEVVAAVDRAQRIAAEHEARS